MGMVNWPQNTLSVQLGTAWLGLNGLDYQDWFHLDIISGQSTTTYRAYSEDGTDTPDDATNRMKVAAEIRGNGEGYDHALTVYCSTGDVWDIAAEYTLTTGSADYTAPEIWSHSPQSELTLTVSNETVAWVEDSGMQLNPGVFWEFYDWDSAQADVFLDPVTIYVTPVTPTVSKGAAITPLVIDVTPLGPFYVGPPPTVATAAAVAIDVIPVAPTRIKAQSPTPVEIDLVPVAPMAARAVGITPLAITITPLAIDYAGGPPLTASPAPIAVGLVPVVPAVRKRFAGSLSGKYRVLNAAEYRFFRTSDGSIPQESDTPYATAANLPDTPADLFGDGTWCISAAWFNGCLQSGFYPVDRGATYWTLVIAGGAQADPPPGPIKVDVKQVADGAVEVRAIYLPPDSETYQWAVAYTTTGVDPAEDAPSITQAIAGDGIDQLVYQLAGLAAGTTVKVRVQVRRFDDPAWTYSDGSTVQTVVIDADPAAVTSADFMIGRLDR